MCNFKSGIILKNKVVLAPEGNESHSDLLSSLGIEDTYENATRRFVRAELSPEDGNKAISVDKWEYKVDQDVLPDWYNEDPGRYEQEFREVVSDYIKGKITVICGYAWTKIKEDENGEYYLMNGILDRSTFGDNNNYVESKIRKELNESQLLKDLKSEFDDRLMPISMDLTSMDGFDDYGTVEGDYIGIPTFDLYRECGKNIPLIENWYWLATPNQTVSRKDGSCVRCVNSDGSVGCGGCGWGGGGVRPFFILKPF